MNHEHTSSLRARPRGFALVDASVAIACVLVVIAFVAPMLAAVGNGSAEARSHSNLRALAQANANYADTFSGRQFTAMPDDAGVVNGNCATYLSSIACPPQQLLGADPDGAMWGYYLGTIGQCSQFGYPGNCANWVLYMPLAFTGGDAGMGSFRIPNVEAFNQFVDGRFYSDVWYSPNDRATWHFSAQYRDVGIEFDSTGGQVAFSSYCFSPAAMFHPDVLGAANGGYRNPNSFLEGYVSPSVSQCAHPDLKTRMLEHNWNLNAPSFADNTQLGGLTAHPFNASAAANPLALFFDGSVRRVRNQDAIEDDQALFESTGGRLWSRATPLGESGYLGAQAIDAGPRTSHTILTIDGIVGRDVLTPRAGPR